MVKNKSPYINDIVKYIKKLYPNKYNFSCRLQKYTLKTIITDIVYMLETGVAWNKYRGKMSPSTIYAHFTFLKKENIFLNFFNEISTKYFKSSAKDKLKYQLTDTTFIKNQGNIGTVGRNKYFKNKNCIKLSLITDSFGFPISVFITGGNKSDKECLENNLNLFSVDTNSKKNNYKYNRYKQYMLADAGYDSSLLRDKLKELGYIPIIPYNKRNTKDKTKIKKLTKNEKNIYKKRILIENIFAHIKKNKRLECVYDKDIKSYLTFLYLAFIKKYSKFTEVVSM